MLDVRLSVVDNTTLIAYHGIISQRTAFTAVVETLQQLLNLHKTECVVVRQTTAPCVAAGMWLHDDPIFFLEKGERDALADQVIIASFSCVPDVY